MIRSAWMDRVDATRSNFSGRAGAAVAVPIARAAAELQLSACVRAVKVSRATCGQFRPRLRAVARPGPPNTLLWVHDGRRQTCTSPSPPPRGPVAPRLACAARGLNNTGGSLNTSKMWPLRVFRVRFFLFKIESDFKYEWSVVIFVRIRYQE